MGTTATTKAEGVKDIDNDILGLRQLVLFWDNLDAEIYDTCTMHMYI
mgnify:CR=1 FL=1